MNSQRMLEECLVHHQHLVTIAAVTVTYNEYVTVSILGWVGHKTHPSLIPGVTKRLSAGHSAQL